MDELTALQEWYANRCNGDWEHGNSVAIGTLDNPGWKLRVNLLDTPSQDKPFEPIKIDRTETDWIVCRREDYAFAAYGGARNLAEMIRIFINWAS